MKRINKGLQVSLDKMTKAQRFAYCNPKTILPVTSGELVITQNHVSDWLGSDSTIEKAVALLTELANKTYPIEAFIKDVKGYVEEAE